MIMPSLWMLVSAITLIFGAESVSAQESCIIVSTSGKTIEYTFWGSTETFGSAKTNCEGSGWHLAMFYSKTDLDDVYGQLCAAGVDDEVWIGAEWKDNAWHWVKDDSVIEWHHFQNIDIPDGKPDKNLSIKKEICPEAVYNFEDKDAFDRKNFICMRELTPSSTAQAATSQLTKTSETATTPTTSSDSTLSTTVSAEESSTSTHQTTSKSNYSSSKDTTYVDLTSKLLVTPGTTQKEIPTARRGTLFKSTSTALISSLSIDTISTKGVENTTVTTDMFTPNDATESWIISQRTKTLNDNILDALGLNLTLNESIGFTQGTLTHMQEIIDDIVSIINVNLELNIPRHIVETLLKMADNLAMLILRKTTSGGGAIHFETRSFVLNLERNSLMNLCNSSLMVGPHSGFEIPSAKHILPFVDQNSILNRMILLFGGVVHQISNMTDRFTSDMLTLSFKNDAGQEMMVHNTSQDIGVWLGNRQTPLNEIMVMGKYIETDAATHYVFGIAVSKRHHAIQIMLETPAPVYENITACVSTELPKNTSKNNGHHFCSRASLYGRVANIFFPEENINKIGTYYVTFDLLYEHGVEFKVSTTQHRCSYSVDNTNTWQSTGCKVSPRSSINSTLCLCKHLT
ncbi:uncharacterized protein [Ptychodera flava]|uniref:uncharacterized protein n=1 Tax=Ptychodera flava TaxID=63121 RepID=UPI00396A4979